MRTSWLVISATCCAACSKVPSTTTVAASGSAGSAAMAAPVDAAVATKPAALSLVVGGDDGLAQIGADGKVIKVLSKTPTSYPRWTPDHTALLFVSTAGELRRVELATGTETVIAKLPASITACPKVTIDRSTLHLQQAIDFIVDKAGTSACIQLSDRNIQMVNTSVMWTVDLASGKVQQKILVSDCPKKGNEAVAWECLSADLAAAKAADPGPKPPPPPPVAKPFGISDHQLVSHGKAISELGTQHDFGEETISPSGKWALLGGNLAQGDYIHRELLLLDRDTGKIYPLPRDAGPWQPAIPAADLPRLDTWSDKTATAVGESTVEWLGDADLLLVDHLLVTPGTGAVRLDGDVAR